MNKIQVLVLTFTAGILLGVVSISTLMAQQRTVKSALLLQSDVAGCAGKEVTLTINEDGPGTSGPHYHPGDSYTYILEGSETYRVEGRPEVVVKAGEVLHEEPGKIHTVGNAAPVKLLVVRIQAKGATESVRATSQP